MQDDYLLGGAFSFHTYCKPTAPESIISPQADLAWALQDTLSVIRGCTVGAGELGWFMVKISKYSLAALGVIPDSAMCFLGDFASPNFPHVSGLPIENFGQEA